MSRSILTFTPPSVSNYLTTDTPGLKMTDTQAASQFSSLSSTSSSEPNFKAGSAAPRARLSSSSFASASSSEKGADITLRTEGLASLIQDLHAVSGQRKDAA
jgi:hypothetical protein